ncbi:MAG: SMP-30/gluconolactonase/LRE family protein [Kiritimatiellia bacterium]
MPYSTVTPPERTKSLGQMEMGDQRIPVVFNGHAHALSPLTPGLRRQNMAWNPQGYVVAVSTLATSYEHGLPRHLLAFHPHGGAPEGIPFVGPEIRPPTGLLWGHGEGDDPYFDHLAVSPDGKWIYYTQTTFYSPHCVFRLAWDEEYGSGMESGWFGEQNRPGSDDRHLNGPEGLAVDQEGRVYVCDRGNSRVVVISPDGIMLGSFEVDSPEQICVHPQSGNIYIFCREAPLGDPPKDIGPISMDEYRAWKARMAARRARRAPPRPTRLLKFSPWGDKPMRELSALDVELDLMALDPESNPPRIWASIKNRLIPITDKGADFEIGNPVDNGEGLVHPAYVAGDPERNRILLYQYSSNFKIFSLELTTGTKRLFLEGVSDFAIAPDGSIYGTGRYGRNELLRFAPDGSPLPFAGMNTNVVKIGSLWVGGVNLGARGITVSPAGDIYVIRAANEKGVQSRVDVYGSDGRLKKAALIDGLGIGDCGIGVDAAGNVYLGVNVKPKDRLYPDEFKGKIPESNWLCWAQWDWHYRPAPWKYSMRNEYLYHWGAVMKFGPAGGAFWGRGQKSYEARRNPASVALVENAPPGAAEYLSGYLYYPVKVVGAQWRYPGMGIVPSSERLWGDPSCVCMGSRLAVDGYGRVFLPNCFLFCVEVIDNAANRITRIGRYGNPDDEGSDPFFAWPGFVSVSGDKLFVADSVNRRVTVVGLSYAAETICQVSQ